MPGIDGLTRLVFRPPANQQAVAPRSGVHRGQANAYSVLPRIGISGKSPTGTVLPPYKLSRLGTVFRNHLRSLPFELLPSTQ